MDRETSIRVEDRHLAQTAPDIVSDGHEYIGRMHDFGGVIKRYTARRELLLSLFDMVVVPGSTSEARSGPCLVVAAVLDGVGRSCFHTIGNQKSDLSLSYASGKTCVFFSTRPVAGQFSTGSAGRFRGMEVRIGLESLRRLGGLEVLEAVAMQSHPLVVGRDGGAWIAAFPTPEPVRRTAVQLLDSDGQTLDDLILEARGLDLLAAAIEAVRAPLSGRSGVWTRNGRQLEEAREVLLADLARPWTVSEIAKRVGLTEKRLKRDFPARFGEPVYGYLQRARLERAWSLLQDGTQTVTEVALAVGYANPSHFAKLFKRQFGRRPSQFKNS